MYKFIVMFTIFFGSFIVLGQNISERWSFLPALVAEFDGNKISRENLVEKIKISPTKLKTASPDELLFLAKAALEQQVEKYIIIQLMQHDGFILSPALALDEYYKFFHALSPASQTVFLKKIKLTRTQLDEHWQKLCRDPDEQFKIIYSAWLQSRISREKVTDDEIETFYREYQNRFRTSEKVQIRSLIVKCPDKAELTHAKEEAEYILAQLRQGMDFAEQEKKYGVADDALTGTFMRGVLPKNIEDVVFAMKIGQISRIITVPAGFVIVKLDKKIPAGYIPLDEIKFRLNFELKRNNVRRWFNKAVIEERAKVNIKKFIN